MEVGPVFYFVLLLIIGFTAYIVLQVNIHRKLSSTPRPIS